MNQKETDYNTTITSAATADSIEMLKRHHVAKDIDADQLDTLAEILCKLDEVSESGDCWSARCPCHNDSRIRLSIAIGFEGRILLNCNEGCEFEQVIESLEMPQTNFSHSIPSIRKELKVSQLPREVIPSATEANPLWDLKQAALCELPLSEEIEVLADQLGVSLKALEDIGVGWCLREACWTFPERNGIGEICGIVRRFDDGTTISMPGSNPGLTLPSGWDTKPGKLHVCVGASNVAVALTAGIRAIGIPSAHSGFDDLAVLLQGFKDDIIIVANNDDDGKSKDLTNELTEQLSKAIQKEIRVISPPPGFRDLRHFLYA